MAQTTLPVTGEEKRTWTLLSTQRAMDLTTLAVLILMLISHYQNQQSVDATLLLAGAATTLLFGSILLGFRIRRHDSATGLLARHAFDEQLTKIISSTKQGNNGCLIMVDLQTEQSHGLSKEDTQIMRLLATSLQDTQVNVRLAGRYAPSMIALLIDDIGHSDAVKAHCSILCSDAKIALINSYPDRQFSLALGACRFKDTDTFSAADPFLQAQQALEHARSQGRSYAVFDAKLERTLRTESNIEEIIRGALTANSVEVHYQPIMDITSEVLVGCEALVRLRDDHDVLMPAERFINIAERRGSIGALGNAVMDKILEDAQRFLSLDGAPFVCINISAGQLDDWDTLSTKLVDLCSTGLKVKLEVSDTTARRLYTLLADLDPKTRRAVSVTLNDYGASVSLRDRLPTHKYETVKINKTRSHEMSTPEGFAIVEALVHMTRTCNKQVVIEGIETPDQLLLALKAGVRQCQGALYAKPMPLDRLIEWVGKSVTYQNDNAQSNSKTGTI